jgi:hypothetical protein
MTTLLIIALNAGMLCVAAWKNPPKYNFPEDSLCGILERIPGFISTSHVPGHPGKTFLANGKVIEETTNDDHPPGGSVCPKFEAME